MAEGVSAMLFYNSISYDTSIALPTTVPRMRSASKVGDLGHDYGRFDTNLFQ